MLIAGVDLHARKLTISILDSANGEIAEKTLDHAGEAVKEFYSVLERPVVVGIEATGSMQWFLELMEELKIECKVGHPAKIRAAEPRKQKNDRRNAPLIRTMLTERRFPSIWSLPGNSAMFGPCCCTVISGCGSEREYRTRCSPLH